MDTDVPNPLELKQSLKRPFEEEQLDCPAQPLHPDDSAVTKAEKVTRNGDEGGDVPVPDPEPPEIKRTNTGTVETSTVDARDKIKGIALVKAE
jgi:tRNA-dihydrouridine synthase 3